MKKLIAILTIMVVLAGVVFAADQGNTSLIVKANIAEVIPTFGLKATGDNVSSLTQAQYANANAETAAIEAQTGYATITDPSDLLSESGTVSVSFAIMQISDASTTKTFYLSVQATDLVWVKDTILNTNKNGGPGAISTATTFSSIASSEKFQVASGTAGVVVPTVAKGADAATAFDATHHIKATANGTTATTLDVQYDGVKVSAYGADNNKEIGTFSVTWNATPDAKPGDYEACVKLTVTSN